jgi:hypothetical protein
MRQHRSAQMVSLHLAKESMTGFAPATIGVILECNKASEANVLTTTPHRQRYACKADEVSVDKKGLYTSKIWAANARRGRRKSSYFRLRVPGMTTDSLPISSAAFHEALLYPTPCHRPTLHTTSTARVRRRVSHGDASGIAGSSILHHHASIHLPLSTIYFTTMPPRWKSDARRRPPRFAYIRSCLPLLVLLILFSFLLSSVALLSHFRSPAAKQQLGWQAWDVVEMHYAKPEDEDTAVFAPSIPLEYWVSSCVTIQRES